MALTELLPLEVSSCRPAHPSTLPRGTALWPRRLKFVCFLLILMGSFQECWISVVCGDQAERLTQLSLEELGNVKVTSVSKEPEQVRKTPAAIFVITQDDI